MFRSAVTAVALLLPTSLLAQQSVAKLSTEAWCDDATTYCWSDTGSRLSGLRLVFEPQVGVLFQNGDNKFENATFESLEKIGLEINLHEGFVGLQALLIYPSTIRFEEDSPLVVDDFLRDRETRQVRVEVGFVGGFTFLDGILALGYGFITYDQRDFLRRDELEAVSGDSPFVDGFWYFNVQPIAAVKSALKGL